MAKWPRFDPDADRRLVRALSEGTEEPLAALYDIYAERLRDYCGSLTRDRRVATDIIHDTLIDASRRVRRIRNQVRLRAWLYAAVRRRCLQRVRHPALHWEYTGDAVDDDAWELLEAAFERLDFADQEALLLTLRHDLDSEDLGALLGIPARRAATRIARAEARAEAAISAAQLTLAQRCAAGLGAQEDDRPTDSFSILDAAATAAATAAADGDEDDDDEPQERPEPLSEAALAEHIADCEDCLRRGDLSLAALLDLVPAPPLPSALRHRVIHTGTDPELAGYRADIAARGGTLNTDGLPRQPDIPSHFARRWLFTGGGMVGALVAAVIAAFLIGPGAPLPDLIWPSIGPHPSKTPKAPTRRPPPPSAGQAQPPPGGSAIPRESAPGANGGREADESPSPGVTGALAVAPEKIDFGARTNVAKLTLTASRAPLTWEASASSNKIALSAEKGTVATDDKSVVTVTFTRALIELPGEETITITDSAGRRHTITVTWQGSLL